MNCTCFRSKTCHKTKDTFPIPPGTGERRDHSDLFWQRFEWAGDACHFPIHATPRAIRLSRLGCSLRSDRLDVPHQLHRPT
ncbi:hypothetical protein RRG08_026501 [Elysia crispata]|uniref:Uncharacterized protein n=1 Tax=Elysia crispata TaxID=231223 RepID=A0AAE1CS93_9GAST|nr:hypothetical protein RRG08_026501 [Elysia crispata]